MAAQSTPQAKSRGPRLSSAALGLLLATPAYAADPVASFQVDYGPYLLNVSLLLLLTVALGYVAYRLKHRQGGFSAPMLRPRGRQVQVLERTSLEGMKSLYLIKCGQKHWVVGTHEGGMTVVGEAEPETPAFEADLADAMHDVPPPSVGDFLRRVFLGRALWIAGFLLISLWLAEPAHAATNLLDSFDLRQSIGSKEMSTPLQMVILMAMLTLAPFLFIMTTSFLRTIIVLGLLRSAMGTQQTPPNQVIMGLSIFLTIYTMAPVWTDMHQNALMPYINKQIPQSVAVERGLEPLKKFMLKQVKKDEMAFFVRLTKIPPPRKPTDIPLHVVVPSFIVSELGTAFKIGFMLFLPFLVIDLVVANTLLALGMMMLSPVTISLPFKILLFTLANGWTLLIQSIVRSFQ